MELVGAGVIVGPVVGRLLVGHQVGDPLEHEVEVVGADDGGVDLGEGSQTRHRLQRLLHRRHDLGSTAGEEAGDLAGADVDAGRHHVPVQFRRVALGVA